MKCRNCQHSLHLDNNFCDECGAKVVQERISFGSLKKDILTRFFGWDNKFFGTTKMLYTKPQVLIHEYLGGVRKKYMNPFSYFGIVVAVSFLFFTQFEKQFKQINDIGYDFMSEDNNLALTDSVEIADSIKFQEDMALSAASKGTDSLSLSDSIATNVEEDTKRKNPFKGNDLFGFILKYFNILQFVNLPFYALISFLVYRKRYNYGEHLVINSFLQGALAIFSFFLFLLGFFTSWKLGQFSFVFTVLYYIIAMKLIMEHSWKQTIIAFFKFIGLLLLMFIAFVLIMLAVVLILKFTGF